ncbi:MAG: hypothetical protein K2X72_19120 [Reyranella sp.]|nr:hypothetical protein [Reyranella sp.]
MPGLEDERDTPSPWKPISTAPFDQDLELAVMEGGEMVTLVVPSRRVGGGWVEARTGNLIAVTPSHWREWPRKPLTEKPT